MAKSRDAFRTISEVAEWLETPAHVLRFWESKFTQIKPVKRAGGRRYYRPADMELLGGIKQLLHEDGMTIKGAQKVLREQGVRHVSSLNTTSIDEDGVVPDADIIEDAPYVEVEVPDSVVAFPGTEAASEAPKPAQTADMFGEPENCEVPAAEDAETANAADEPEEFAGTITPKPEESVPVEDAAREPTLIEAETETADSGGAPDEHPDSIEVPETPMPNPAESLANQLDDEPDTDHVVGETPIEPSQPDALAETEQEPDAGQNTSVGSDENSTVENVSLSNPVESEVLTEESAVEVVETSTDASDAPAEAKETSPPVAAAIRRPALLSLLAQVESLSQEQAQALRPLCDALREHQNKHHVN